VDLDLTEEQEFFRDTTRRFVEAEAPIVNVRRPDGADSSWWQKAAELGWTSLLVSEEAGGGCLSGRPVADAAIVAEEMGRQVAPGPFCPVSVVASALSADTGRHGESLRSLVAGSTIAVWAFAERGGSWDADGIGATAVSSSDDVVINGVKSFVEAASVADQFLVTARTGKGVTQVLVPAGSEGLTVVPSRSLDLARRFGDVRLEGVRVPRTAVVGEVSGAAAQVERQLQIAIALQCAETVGLLDRVFEFTLQYMNDRYAFGRPISSYQALKHRAADILLWLESAKATTDGLIKAIDEGAPDAVRLASVAKAYIGDKSLTIIQECVQFHGGIGVTWEHDIHLYLRRATVNRAVYGTPEQHRGRLCRLLDLEKAA
jgi:alkylation response protein AidB-like acyl-CoA dehydrogenase